jgi:hypothetical protein
MGWLELNAWIHGPTHYPDYPIPIKQKIAEKSGADSEQQEAKERCTQQHKNWSNFLKPTEMTAYKCSCKDSLQQAPPTTLEGNQEIQTDHKIFSTSQNTPPPQNRRTHPNPRQPLSNPMEPLVSHLKRTEVQAVINSIHPNKSPGYDLITRKIQKELPTTGIRA